MKQKHPIAILATITLLTTLLVPMFLTPFILAEDSPSSEYITVEGVLDTDYYTLYPYTDKSLDIGFSKFGEIIDCNTGTGMNYSGRDPFANEGIDINRWLNGWFIDISYKHRWLAQKDRKLWAMAMFADGLGCGGDWATNVTDPRDAPHGGRKTSTNATTANLTVLYDGPRRFVAVSTTHIYDVEEESQWPIVDVILTLIFNKVKKEIIVLKDIKLTIESKDLLGKVDIEFSNRAEWDLGPAPNYASYAHFYHQYGNTCYGGEWLFTNAILRKQVDEYTYETNKIAQWSECLKCPTLEEFPVAEGSEKVYINDVLLERGADKDYTIDYDTGVITFLDSYAASPQNPLTLVVEYKNVMKWLRNPETGEDLPESHRYDVAQMISSDKKVVGFAAFWPTTSDYTVDGWDDWYQPLRSVPPQFSNDVDMTQEPDIPFVIGEWDFLLSYTPEEMQFRGVSVYGITDYHDAEDIDMGSSKNMLDREVQFQLDEVFQPFDLKDAVHKSTKRWVEFKPTGPTSWTLTAGTPVVVVDDEEWDQYSTFSEKVIRLDKGELLHRRSNDPVAGGAKDYNIVLNPDGTATLTGLPSAECKILYSTREIVGGTNGLIQLGLTLDGSGSISAGDWTIIKNGVADAIVNSLPHDGSVELTVVQFGFDTPLYSQIEVAPTVINSDATANAVAAMVLAMAQGNANTPMAHGLNLTWSTMKASSRFDVDSMQIINVATDGLANVLLPESPTGDAEDDVTWVRIMAVIDGLDEIDAEAIGAGADVDWMKTGLVWPQPGTIVDGDYVPGWVEAVPDVEAFAEAMATKFEIIIPIRGRYEWIVVGKDSATVDSLGAAYMTEAFDSIKDIPVQLAGLDIRDTEYGVNVPFVMAGASTGTRTDYYYSDEDDHRTGLKDDWCRTYPISSSNMLFVGGPRANLGTEYFNEFTNAFFAAGGFVVDDIGQGNKILALTCWNKNTYGSGYAVISTYKDINGTVGFLIWGMDGQDTYYATKWFWDIPKGMKAHDGTMVYSGIEYLQHENDCVTDIILKISYSKCEPTLSVVEHLGTISEKPQHDP